ARWNDEARGSLGRRSLLIGITKSEDSRLVLTPMGVTFTVPPARFSNAFVVNPSCASPRRRAERGGSFSSGARWDVRARSGLRCLSFTVGGRLSFSSALLQVGWWSPRVGRRCYALAREAAEREP